MQRRTLPRDVRRRPRLPALAAPSLPQVQVYKNPACGCCGSWAAHMEAAGFPVRINAVDDTGPFRRRYGIPDSMAS